MSEKADNKLLLIDGNSIMNRAFYGVGELTNASGLHTNAIYGFLNMFFRTLEEENASHVIVAFDLKAPTFRHKMFKEYKGNRKGMPDELREQMPVIKEVLGMMNVQIKEIEGFEADDVLGTLTVLGEKDGMDVTLFSGDRDMLQLATDKVKISIPKTSKGTTKVHHYHKADVLNEYQVTPEEFIDVKALMGDSSDNIPGVKGVGEKTAIKLIKNYHSLDGVYENLDELGKSVRTKLETDREVAFVSKTLVTICTDCIPEIDFNKTKIVDMFNENVYVKFKELEFKSMLSRFEEGVQENMNDHSFEFEKKYIQSSNELNQLIAESSVLAYDVIFDEENMYLTLTNDGDSIYYTHGESVGDEEIVKALSDLLLNQSIKKITHDLKIQLHQLSLDIPLENQSIYDLSLMYYLLNANKDSYYLDDIANEFLRVSLLSEGELLGKGKKKIRYSEVEEAKLIEYAMNNCKVLFDAYEPITKRIEKEELLDLYFDIELKLLYVLKAMESEGIRIDQEGLKVYGEKLDLRIGELEKTIHTLAGESFNVGSPKQLGVILFEKLGLPVVKKTKTGYSTAADVLEKLHGKHEIIPMIIEYRQLTKLNSTYAKGLVQYIEEDGRIHTTFKQQIASTGRISSIEPNLQNIPMRLELGREIRKVFIPKEEHVFIDADYSQIELRILAHLSEDENFVDAFNHNIDVHSMTASKVFHVPLEEVTSLQRRNAKAVNFGIVYGISSFGLSRDLDIMVKEAKVIIDNYFDKYPKVKGFLDDVIDEAKLTGGVKTMYNRTRLIPELSSSNFMVRSAGERIAMNTPIQGSAADIIKIAMINVYNKLKEMNLQSKLLLQVHDELLIETHKDEVDTVLKLLVDEMENVAKLKVPLTVDAHVGNSWYDAK